MKFFHTADWHLGKLVQGVHMTEDQQHVLRQLLEAIAIEKPDAVIIAGDLYDRAIPPTEAVQLLNDVLERIVLQLNTPVLVIAGNHDSPSRLHFGSNIMKEKGFHIVGQFNINERPVILNDEFGEVHFHLVPYCDPSIVRNAFQDDDIKTHDDAMRAIIEQRMKSMDETARHVFVGHAFVTPKGEEKENTSDSERPLTIGGAEQINANVFEPFHYTALGHLHQAHKVGQDNIRYAGSLLKYSISEEHHDKGFLIVDMDKDGHVEVEKRSFKPRRDMRTVATTLEELYTLPMSDDYVFVNLLDETPVLSPMEKVRSVFPHAMHVERAMPMLLDEQLNDDTIKRRSELNDVDLFRSFYKEVKGIAASEEVEAVMTEVLNDLLKIENETIQIEKTVQTDEIDS